MIEALEAGKTLHYLRVSMPRRIRTAKLSKCLIVTAPAAFCIGTPAEGDWIPDAAPLPVSTRQPNAISAIDAATAPELDKLESEWVMQDPRVAWLEAQLKSLRPQKSIGHMCSQRDCRGVGALSAPKAGVRCAAFHEALSLIERDRAAATSQRKPAERRR